MEWFIRKTSRLPRGGACPERRRRGPRNDIRDKGKNVVASEAEQPQKLYLYLFTTIIGSLVVGRFTYLSLLYLGEIQEFRDHFRFYPFFYLLLFGAGFVAISLLYLYFFSRLGRLTLEVAAYADLVTNFLFLLLLPYVLAFRYSLHVFGFGLFYLTVVSVVIAKAYVLMSSIWQNRPRDERLHYGLLVIILSVGIALRLLLMLTASRVVDSDEAIWGLMARHIILLGEHPTLFYGQPYMGSLSAYLAAPLFLVFGASSMILKLIPLTYSLIFLLTMYLLGRNIFSPKVALVSLLLASVGPFILIFHNVTQWGYMEALALGNMVLLLLIRMLKQSANNRESLILYGLLGFALGIGFWLSVFMTVYIATALILLLAKERLSFFGWKSIVLLAFFLLGLLPLIVFNLHNGFATWDFLMKSGGQSALLGERWQWAMMSGKALFVNALPGILGIRRTFSYANFLLYLLYVGLAAVSIGFSWWGHSDLKGKASSRGVEVLYLLGLLTIGSFLLSKVAAIYQVSRYLIALYSIMPLLIGMALVRLLELSKGWGVLLLVIILAANLNGVLEASRVRPPAVLLLARRLEKVGAKYALANYWTSYQLTFVSKEKIICASHSGGWSHRYPEYNNQFDRASSADQALVLPLKSPDVGAVKARFKKLNIAYSEISAGGYIILHSFSKALTGAEVPDLEVGYDPRLQLGN